MKCLKCSQETGADWKTLCLTHYKNRSPEEMREARQKKLDKKIARMRSKAERLEKEGESKQTAFKSHHGDIAFFTQPANPSSPFGRQRTKIYQRYDEGIKLEIEADELQKKAAYLEKRGAIVKGDAEKARQEKREHQDNLISVGAKVYDFAFREGQIIKVNKKTYTIRFASGFTCTRDKTFVKLIKE